MTSITDYINKDTSGDWHDMLKTRSVSSIASSLQEIVHKYHVRISGVCAWVNVETREQLWAVTWYHDFNIADHVIVVRYLTGPDHPAAGEFYRRAEKRLKLFAELVRD